VLDCFFNPRSVALVGASLKPEKLSSIIFQRLKAGFPGSFYPVNPAHEELDGIKCYPSIEDIGRPVDLAVFAISAAHIPAIVQEASGLIGGAVVVSGGFAEAGDEGAALEEELRECARSAGPRVIGPNCLGIFDNISGLDTFFIPPERMERPGRGGLSILSQSGSFALTVMDELAADDVGVARVISYGNKADVNECDLIEWLAADEATGAVVMYIESVDEGRRFVDAASRCAREKPIAALKAGHTAPAAAAARSHTGALAGRYEVYRAAFRKAGVMELTGYEDFLVACKVLAAEKPAEGGRVIIITDGGGLGVAIADDCADLGLEVPPLGGGAAGELRAVLPPVCSISNPLDLTGSVTDWHFSEAISKTLEGDEYDMAIVASLWGPPGLTDDVAGIMADKKTQAGKPLIICTPGGRYTRERMGLFRQKGLTVFSRPGDAARAALLLARAGMGRKQDFAHGP